MRFDVSFGPGAQREAEPAPPIVPLVLDETVLLEELLKVQSRILSGGLDTYISRIGFYVQCVLPSSDHRDANRALINTLPQNVAIPIDNQEDFILQLNEPLELIRDSDAVRLNRITKWSVDRWQVVSLTVPIDLGGTSQQNYPISSTQTSHEHIVASVGFDINSSPKDAPLSKSLQEAILTHAFAEFAKKQEELRLGLAWV